MSAIGNDKHNGQVRVAVYYGSFTAPEIEFRRITGETDISNHNGNDVRHYYEPTDMNEYIPPRRNIHKMVKRFGRIL